jgi:hypothetical protein
LSTPAILSLSPSAWPVGRSARWRLRQAGSPRQGGEWTFGSSLGVRRGTRAPRRGPAPTELAGRGSGRGASDAVDSWKDRRPPRLRRRRHMDGRPSRRNQRRISTSRTHTVASPPAKASTIAGAAQYKPPPTRATRLAPASTRSTGIVTLGTRQTSSQLDRGSRAPRLAGRLTRSSPPPARTPVPMSLRLNAVTDCPGTSIKMPTTSGTTKRTGEVAAHGGSSCTLASGCGRGCPCFPKGLRPRTSRR